MIDFKSPHERYYQDPDFHALVDRMVWYIATCKYTPSEMREASLLACIDTYKVWWKKQNIYGMCTITRTVFDTQESLLAQLKYAINQTEET